MADFQDFIRKTAGQMGAFVCYTDTIENCTRAQGQAEATPRRTLLRRCPFCMRGKGRL